MISKLLRLLLPTAFIVVGLPGCNGGGNDQVAGGGIGGTGAPVGISFGEVTQQGSIFVNGIEFNTANAKVDKDGVALTNLDSIQVGMTVEVHGSIDSSTKGTAQEVLIDEAVRGQVESVDPSSNSFTVLGQTVLVDQSTNYDQSSLPNGFLDIQNLVSTDIVEVHGLVKNYGTIDATFIQKFTPSQQTTLVTKYSVRGFVENHMPNGMGGGTFQIGPSLTVSYDNMTDLVAGLPSNWNNLYLDIKGDSCNGTPPVCGTLHAVVVDFEGFPTDQTIPNAEMEGFIRETHDTTPALPLGQFTVAGQRVAITGSTAFVNGMATAMVVGVKVEVEGSLAGGILTATRITFKDDAFESDATFTGSALRLAGLSAITVTADSQTKFTGFASGAVPSLSDANGQHVRVRGREDVGNNIIATEIELRDPKDIGKVFISGQPKSVVSPTFTILGVLVDTTMSVADSGFVDVNDAPIGKAAFFNVLSVGDHLVKAKGTLNSSNVVIWEEVELED